MSTHPYPGYLAEYFDAESKTWKFPPLPADEAETARLRAINAELLAFAKDFLFWTEPGPEAPLGVQARAAIAKATGEAA